MVKPKLDANDQQEISELELEKINKLFDELAKINPPRVKKEIVYPMAASIIAGSIASQFYSPASLFHADLRRLISEAIEKDREFAREIIETLT